MSGDIAGRKVSISIAAVIAATARTKSLNINNTTINVTADDDDGIQKLLDIPGEKSVDISVSGMRLVADTQLLDLSLSPTITADIEFDYGAYTLSGSFALTSYSENLPYQDAVTFDASFSSAGALTKTLTPPPP